jgi:hypothetical protein
MTLRLYLWGLKIGALVSLIGWLVVIFNVDPLKDGPIGLLLFYGSLFLFLATTLIVLFTAARRPADESEADAQYLKTSFRQGMLLATLGIIFLVMQSYRMLVWWDGLLVVAGILLVELYFLVKQAAADEE